MDTSTHSNDEQANNLNKSSSIPSMHRRIRQACKPSPVVDTTTVETASVTTARSTDLDDRSYLNINAYRADGVGNMVDGIAVAHTVEYQKINDSGVSQADKKMQIVEQKQESKRRISSSIKSNYEQRYAPVYNQVDPEGNQVFIHPWMVAHTNFDYEIIKNKPKRKKANRKIIFCICFLLFCFITLVAVLVWYFLASNRGDDDTRSSQGKTSDYNDNSNAGIITDDDNSSNITGYDMKNDKINDGGSSPSTTPTLVITNPPNAWSVMTPSWSGVAHCANLFLELSTDQFGNETYWEIISLAPVVAATTAPPASILNTRGPPGDNANNLTIVSDNLDESGGGITTDDGSQISNGDNDEKNSAFVNFTKVSMKTDRTVGNVTNSGNHQTVLFHGGPYFFHEGFNSSQGLENQYNENFCLPEGSYQFILYDWNGNGICCEYGHGKYGLLFSPGRPIRPTSLGNFTGGKEVTEFNVTLSDIIFSSSTASPSLLTLTSTPTTNPTINSSTGKFMGEEGIGFNETSSGANSTSPSAFPSFSNATTLPSTYPIAHPPTSSNDNVDFVTTSFETADGDNLIIGISKSHGIIFDVETSSGVAGLVVTGMDLYIDSSFPVFYEVWTKKGSWRNGGGEYFGYDNDFREVAHGVIIGKGVCHASNTENCTFASVESKDFEPVTIEGGETRQSFWVTLTTQDLVSLNYAKSQLLRDKVEEVIHASTSELKVYFGSSVLTYPLQLADRETDFRANRGFIGRIRYRATLGGNEVDDYNPDDPTGTLVPSFRPSTADSSSSSDSNFDSISFLPTVSPSDFPTAFPTNLPTYLPTTYPTNSPTYFPTAFPTNLPTYLPTTYPTNSPTYLPTAFPTIDYYGPSSTDTSPPHTSGSCFLNEEESCRNAAKELGLHPGGAGYSFAGDYTRKGCYYYPCSNCFYGGMAFFGKHGSLEEMESSNSILSEERLDCRTTRDEIIDAISFWCIFVDGICSNHFEMWDQEVSSNDHD